TTASEAHDDVIDQPNVEPVTGLSEAAKVGVRRRPRVKVGMTKLIIGAKPMRDAIAPFSFVEAVGRRKQLNGVNTEFGDVGASCFSGSEIVEVGSLRFCNEQGQDVSKSAHPALGASPAWLARPSSRQFVDDGGIVGREVAKVRYLRCCDGCAVGIARD